MDYSEMGLPVKKWRASCQRGAWETVMSQLNTNDVVMTVPEVAEYLRVSKSKVYELAQREKIPCRKVGGSWRFLRSQLDEWLTGTVHVPGDEVYEDINEIGSNKES